METARRRGIDTLNAIRLTLQGLPLAAPSKNLEITASAITAVDDEWVATLYGLVHGDGFHLLILSNSVGR